MNKKTTETIVAELGQLGAQLTALERTLQRFSVKLDSRASQPDLGALSREVIQVTQDTEAATRAVDMLDDRVERRNVTLIAWQQGIDGFVGEINDRVASLEEAVVNLINAAAEARYVDDIPIEDTVAGDSIMTHYRDALTLIAQGGRCETSTRSETSCINNPARSVHYKYGADRWCDPCIAHAALNGIELR